MARKIPVINWRARESPNNEPKFHAYERLEGPGRSTSISVRGRKRGWCLSGLMEAAKLALYAIFEFLELLESIGMIFSGV